ncbi:MAG: enoyl-CoA hydratase/isomerase family protein [Gammaproteobacteria bacterium]|nr:enoyl-CoA hydratase/isomerase family protein [Gammaproteobacteria bacterium]
MTESNTTSCHWHLERDQAGIAWLRIDVADGNVNVLSLAVISELQQKVDELVRNPPRGLIIHSGKPNGFIAGADIKSFLGMKSEQEAAEFMRGVHTVFDRLESLSCPTVAAIHGFCLGGGLELALACHYRVADEDQGTRIGLPEVLLGIHPGFGGTMRSIRLIGVPAAMDLMLSGRPLSARAAAKLGLIDHAVPQRHLLRAARMLVLDPPQRRQLKPWLKSLNLPLLRPLLARYLRRQVASRANREHYPAPYAMIDLWERNASDPKSMLADEAASVAHLVMGDSAQNLIRVFFLQERLKAAGRDSRFKAQRVHVIGAGVMGGDIAAWCALQGLMVTLQDQSPERIAPAVKRAAQLFSKKLKQPRLVQAALDRLIPDVAGQGVPHADVIIEAIFENAEAKQALYRTLEPRMKPGAILATNTSSIPLQTLTPALQHPQRLVGLHFFNPVAKMQLVEIVHSPQTDEQVVRDASAFARQIGKLPLAVTSTPGFLVNRILMPYLLEAVELESEGVRPELIDRAAVAFGMPMGPIELADTVGLDICLSVAEILGQSLGNARVPARLRALVSEGRLGRKNGQGFYSYRNGEPVKARISAGMTLPADVTDRMMLRLLNEAMACLRGHVVEDEDLLDAGIIFGTGFAPFRGGPLHHVRERGISALRGRLEELARNHGARFTPDEEWQRLQAL